ncbi:MAG: serine/threonine-protein kinase [Thermodesulfobacteriota bacterium]
MPSNAGGNEVVDDAFLKAWLIVAIYHDQGYVFQLGALSEAQEHLRRVYTQFNSFFEVPLSKHLQESFGITFPQVRERRARAGLRLPQAFHVESVDDLLFEPDGEFTILDEIEPLINSYRLGPPGSSLARYFEMARHETPLGRGELTPYYDHGVVSAIMLLRLHRELQRYVTELATFEEKGELSKFVPNEEIRQVISLLADELNSMSEVIKHTAAAIAVHNIDKNIWDPNVYSGARYDLSLETFQICLADNPLSFLLCLCDNLQDWDRPRFALPRDTDDHIRIDQHMLISACDHGIGVRFYPVAGQDELEEEQCFGRLRDVLCIFLSQEDVESLVCQDAMITRPDLLSTESIDQARARQRVELQRKYDLIDSKWRGYRSTIDSECDEWATEEERRSRRLRHFRAFLKWCEDAGYDYVKPAPSQDLERLYGHVKAEINDLNYVIPGTELDGRKIIEKIGAGGYGTVLKVQSQISPEAPLEALKVFHTSNFAEPELVARFTRGYHSMTTLQHPQITRVSSYMTIPRGYFMDFIEGENLATFMDRRPLRKHISTAKDRLALMVEVCHILEYAHQEGVRHRDIKPENIIMRWSEDKNRFEPVLTDFDLAWYMQAIALTVSGAELVGSYLYAAPEQKKPKEDTDLVHRPTVDIFSLGRLLYFVFTEQTPEEDVDLSERLYRCVKERYPELRSQLFPFELASIYRKATRILPRERFQRVQDLRMALEELLRLLGAMEGTFEERIFLHELALRLNGRIQYEKDAELAARGTVAIALTEGEIMVKSIYPDEGRPYLNVQVSVSQSALAILQQRTYKKARERLNSRIEKWVGQAQVNIYNAHKGTREDLFSYTFRVSMPEFTGANLEMLYGDFDALKSVL